MLIPLQTIGVCAAATIFVVMLSLGLAIPPERLGYLWRRPALALGAEPVLARLGNALFAVLAIVIVADVWNTAIGVGLPAIGCALALALASIGIGLLLGRPDPETRPAMAVISAMRNPGLALLLASANRAAPGVIAMILAYLLCSAAVVITYVIWRRRVAG